MALAAVPLAVRAPDSPAARSESWRGKTNGLRQRDLGLAGAVWRMGNVWVSYTKLSRPYATRNYPEHEGREDARQDVSAMRCAERLIGRQEIHRRRVCVGRR